MYRSVIHAASSIIGMTSMIGNFSYCNNGPLGIYCDKFEDSVSEFTCNALLIPIKVVNESHCSMPFD